MRSQLGLHRRGRLASNGMPPPGPGPDPDPVDETDEPDTPEELAAALSALDTHAEIDAWVQEHEANLPERPNNWSGLSRANKREWVMANYDFTAPDPEEPVDPDPEPSEEGGEAEEAGDEEAGDEEEADEDDGA